MKKLLTILFAFALGLSLSAQVPDYLPTEGLVAWYPLDGDLTNELNLDESRLLIGGSFVPGQANDAARATFKILASSIDVEFCFVTLAGRVYNVGN